MSRSEKNPNRGTILVVDDNEDNLNVLSRRLERGGFTVLEANSGANALELVSQKRSRELDVILLDVMMPGIDGFEVLRRLRIDFSPTELPIILVTAKDQSEDIISGLNLGANDYITKPIDFPVLLARVNNNVRLAESHRALKSAQKFLIDAAKMESIGYLAAGVAHEIRNPLAQIQMGVDYIKMVAQEDEEGNVAMILDTMEQAVDSADRIVKNLMQFSSRRKIEYREADLAAVVDTCLRFIGGQAADRGISITHERDDVCVAEVDVSQMETALLNVLKNALQSMPNGGTLAVSTQRATLGSDQIGHNEGARSGNVLRVGDEIVIIRIQDSGTGIPEEKLPTIFDAFFTSHATGKGTGLGLTVAKKIVDLHRGLLTVANRTDQKGVAVTFTLPSKALLSTSV